MLLFYATTDTLLIDCFNLKVISYPNTDADIFINDIEGRMSPDLIHEIKRTNVFREVILLHPSQTVPNIIKQHPKKSILITILNILPIIIDGILTRTKYLKEFKRYSEHVIYKYAISPGLYAHSSYFIYYAFLKNPGIKIRLIEHGATSFYLPFDTVCNPYLEFSGSKYNIIYEKLLWYLHTLKISSKINKIFKEKIESFYAYNTKASNQLTQKKLPCLPAHSLMPITTQNPTVLDLLQHLCEKIDVVEYLKRDYYFITFSDASESHPQHRLFLNQIKLITTSVGAENLVVKAHPGMQILDVSSLSTKIYIDNRKYLLEALYSKINLNNKILIAYSSGAVFHPKYMFNMEPYVILTYKLYPELSINSFDNTMLEEISSDLINAYSNKNKIFIPNSLGEFAEIIEKIHNSKQTII